MKKFFLVGFFLILSSCMQTENSSTLDPEYYGQSSSFPAEVKEVFSQNCTPCHSFQARTVADLVSDGLLIQGDSQNSALYYRLRNSSGNNGPKDMPTWGSITSPQIQIIEEWIDSL